MDFTKFVWLLERRALYFARADRMEDPFEGSSTHLSKAMRPVIIQKIKDEHYLIDPGAQLGRIAPKWAYLNCWHLSSHESAAMWKLYAQTSEAIAIRSTYQRLYDCLPPDVYVGCIKYIDYTSGTIPQGTLIAPFLHKRISFQHEHEVRALTMQFPSPKEPVDLSKEILTPPGKEFAVNLDALFDSIYVSPTCRTWFVELVKAIVSKYGLRKDVRQSSLAQAPIY